MVNCHCGKRTVYNVNGEKALYCSAHKEPNMINVTTKKCEYKGGCLTRPSFGIHGGKKQFCAIHKEANMVDVIHDLCQADDCDTIAYYNKKGEKKENSVQSIMNLVW